MSAGSVGQQGSVSSFTSPSWARVVAEVELVKVMSVFPVSPWRNERFLRVSHVRLTDRDVSHHGARCRSGQASLRQVRAHPERLQASLDSTPTTLSDYQYGY